MSDDALASSSSFVLIFLTPTTVAIVTSVTSVAGRAAEGAHAGRVSRVQGAGSVGAGGACCPHSRLVPLSGCGTGVAGSARPRSPAPPHPLPHPQPPVTPSFSLNCRSSSLHAFVGMTFFIKCAVKHMYKVVLVCLRLGRWFSKVREVLLFLSLSR